MSITTNSTPTVPSRVSWALTVDIDEHSPSHFRKCDGNNRRIVHKRLP